MSETTWRIAFETERSGQSDETFVVAVAPEGIELDKEFDASYGMPEGEPVLIWTKARVYFPVAYDGAEWMGSAPRHPTGRGQDHVGGG